MPSQNHLNNMIYYYTCEFCQAAKFSEELPSGWLEISVEGEDGWICDDCRERLKGGGYEHFQGSRKYNSFC
jgi:ribosomal protein L37AE/L43A